MKIRDQWSNCLRPDAQAFDEVRIVTVPRYKQSGLSGDEWRISAITQIFRKGKLIHDQEYANVEYAARLLDSLLIHLRESGSAYYAGEDELCDQEGCIEKATVFYQKKLDYCSSCGNGKEITYARNYRKFCHKHKTRGDCGLDDADANYTLLEGNPK